MTYLTRMVAFLITVFLGLFSVVGTPTWKREAPLRVAAYIVVSDVEAAKALDDSHLDDLTDIILIGNTGWFGTDGKLHMAEAFGDVAAWFRARTAKNHTRLLVTIGGNRWKCGKVHTVPFAWLIKFFHSIQYFFKNLFK